jgi:uncharacterized protein YndB with AHSA1/START domain
MGTIHQDTIRLERDFDVPPNRVFEAYADPGKRVRWVVPSATEVLIYSATDFSVGGTDDFICGPRKDPAYTGSTRYEHIEQDAVIVCHERLHHDGRLLSLATISWTFDSLLGGTRLTLVDQVTAIDSAQTLTGHRIGHTAALTNLTAFLVKGEPS